MDGNDGQDGVDGTDGQPGANGLTPYIGTNGHWWIGETDTGIAAQGATGETGAKGDKGDTGATGQTGAAGTNGTNGQDGQNGQDGSSGQNGTNGLSAYEIYLLYHPAYTGTEAQWIDDLVNGRLAESDPYTEGLVFALSTDGLTYAITGYTGTATEVVIPGRYYGKQITSIASQAFYNCGGITSITIPASVTGIGEGAFSGCSGLAGITLPFVGASKTATGTSALFGYIFGTASYTGGTSTQQYYASNTSTTYYIPTALRTVVIASATKLEYGAFYGCSGLTSITIPASVTSIGSYAFSGCSGITSITIPDSVTSIGGGAFSGTAWYNAQPNGLVYAGKVAYKYKGTMPANTSITLLAGTKGIAGQAFYNCSGLTSITIPAGVTSIGESAFYYCSGLTSITIPAGVTSIGDIAFAYCSSLTVISYRGTEAEWNLIPKGILWNNNCPAVIVYDYED
ncbi:MAG: collagen-like protein [Clostridiales bacterium]|nr:collagen-like protein [Clostridiales bacterium]